MAAFCLNALTGAGGLWVIVRRAKQCLDFAATAHFIHLIICAIYSGFPSTLTWWLLNITCMALMAVIGEFACMRTELKAIPVSVASVKSTVWCYILMTREPSCTQSHTTYKCSQTQRKFKVAFEWLQLRQSTLWFTELHDFFGTIQSVFGFISHTVHVPVVYMISTCHGLLGPGFKI